MINETEEGQTHFCPFCKATKMAAQEQVKILKKECEEMKRERDLALMALEKERMRADDSGYSTARQWYGYWGVNCSSKLIAPFWELWVKANRNNQK